MDINIEPLHVILADLEKLSARRKNILESYKIKKERLAIGSNHPETKKDIHFEVFEERNKTIKEVYTLLLEAENKLTAYNKM
jgi:hypothetical protein